MDLSEVQVRAVEKEVVTEVVFERDVPGGDSLLVMCEPAVEGGKAPLSSAAFRGSNLWNFDSLRRVAHYAYPYQVFPRRNIKYFQHSGFLEIEKRNWLLRQEFGGQR